MSPDARSESAIFRAAALLPPDERPAYLDQACGENRPLRHEVESLLQAHDPEASFLKAPAPAVTIDRPITERPGTIIGPYKLMEQIGEGGFGLVFVAEQHQPVRRKVALKVIKPGMDTREVVARFEAERQALAMMDHPHIAKVLDAGTTESGRPYFVMELVRGIPITDYCDQNQLSPRERLPLFIAVCQAVQHAHQKGVIHRDLKPTNILVAPHDGIPVVKVIDFGVAKALGQQLTDKTIYTRFAQFIGTPLYMSPEQAEINALDVDTRSDVYSLGVLLYELITGTTPFDKQRLASAAFDEIRRIIREEEPPTMCARLAKTNRESRNTETPGAPGRTGAANPKSKIPNPKSLAELDWIVMKCLEKDRTRRYETANNLARDVQRYLADEPVEACLPSLTYRLSKVARRYKAPLAIAAAFLALLLSGIAVSSWQAVRATTAERAAAASKQKADVNAKSAQDNEQIAKQERDSAEREKSNALAAREELRDTLYASEMNLVQAASESRQYARAAQLLERQRPAAGQPDPRGFEWHYWQRRLKHGWLRSVEVPQLASRYALPGGALSFSRGAARLAAVVDYPADSQPQTGFGLLAIFDGVTGRELVAPFDPFPDQQRQTGGNRNRWLFMTMSDDGTRLAAALGARLSGPFSTAEQAGNAAEQVGHISIRDAATGSEIRRIENPGVVCDIALTADGSRIAVEYREDGSPAALAQTSGQTGIKIWDTSTGECVQTLPRLPWTSLSNRLLWSPDGARLLRQSVLSESDNNRPVHVNRQILQIVDVASGEELWERKFTNLANQHDAWSWSPDGKLLVIFEIAEPGVAAKHNVQLWDSHTGTVLAILDREAPSDARFDSNVVFSPDGQFLAVAARANEIYVWEVPKLPLATGATPLRIAAPDLTLQAAGRDIQGLAFSEGGRMLHSVDLGGSLVTWNATAREDAGIGPATEGFFNATLSPDATKAAFVTREVNNRICSVWDLAKNQEVCRLKTEWATFIRPYFSADGRRIALAPLPGAEIRQILIHDTQTGEPLKTIQVDQLDSSLPALIGNADFRPDGRQFAALIRTPSQAQIPETIRLMAWDVATGKRQLSVPMNSPTSPGLNSTLPPGLWYSHDGASLMVVLKRDPSEWAVLYDAVTGDFQGSIFMPTSPRRYYINFQHQVVGANDRLDFVLWDLTTGKERLRLPGYNGVNEMAISPDGRRLVLGKSFPSSSGGFESELTLLSLKAGRRLLAFSRQGRVTDVSFSPDGNRLVAAFSPSGPRAPIKPIQIWDTTPLSEESAK